MIQALVTVILPVVLAAAVGVVLARSFSLDQDTVGKVSLHGLTPFLALHSLLTTSLSASAGLGLAAAYLVSTGLAGGIAALSVPGVDRDTRRSVVACTTIGNNGNFGLPIALLALGQAGLDQAILIFVCSIVVMFTAGPALLGAHPSLSRSLLTVIRLPVIWAMVIAFVVRATGLQLPAPILTTVSMLAAAAVPVVLLSLGMQLATTRRVRATRPMMTAVVIRVIVLPLLSVGVGLVLGLRGLPLQSLVLAQAMPTAVNAFMLAREYGTDVEGVAGVVALTTFASIPTLALAIWLLPHLA